MPELPLLLTPTEAAKELGVGRDYVYEAIHSGRLQSIRVGRYHKIPRSALPAFIAQELEGTKA